MKDLLAAVIAAVEAEGVRLAAEFTRADGPRGRRGSAPIDLEIEERLRETLQGLLPCTFVGEETGISFKEGDAVWLVDPQDGTSEFTGGKRGSAISVALLKKQVPVLGVVHSPLSPDRGRDTIAWAEGTGPIRRNGKPLDAHLAQHLLAAGEIVFTTGSSALRPGAWSRACSPARYIAMPSIAYRLARVAAGDGVATVSIHGVSEYDVAAGMALVRAAGGVLLDAEGKEVALTGARGGRLSGCFAGAPAAAAQLAGHDWSSLENEPPQKARVVLGFPRRTPPERLDRGQACLLGQVIGDSLGSLVESKSAAEIVELYPQGLRDLADGGVHHTIAGQPTDDSEMALALARCIVAEKQFVAQRALDAYREWLTTRPVDIAATTERGLLGLQTGESESNGSLMRVSPLGVWAAGDPARAAAAAREDSALTHRNPVCVEACAAYAAAIAVGVAGGSRAAMREAALEHSRGKARELIEQGGLPDDFMEPRSSVRVSLLNAFHHLERSGFEEALLATVAAGGATDTNAAVCGALLGAALGRQPIPSRWVLPVLACRATLDAGAPRPRPAAYWPDDILELAEALLEAK
ncbi:MAG TPA: inositol monophosphatase family protein [Burkholderiales bacterium]|nr:inositol monophosphatase family protein [Burkholderiales bacterium]